MMTHERCAVVDHEQMSAESDFGPPQGASVALVTGCEIGHVTVALPHRILLQEGEGMPGNSFRSRLRPGIWLAATRAKKAARELD